MAIVLTYPAGGMLVTGGTGKVGQGVVRRLADAGVPLIFTYRKDSADAGALEVELRDAGHQVHAQQMDMSDMDSITKALDRVSSEYGSLHGVVCAGGPKFDFHRIMDVPVDEAERFVHNDALGVFRVLHAATPILRSHGGGTITVCTTIATRRAFEFDGLSPLSKGSVDALIHHVAAEEAANGIRCNGVAIGWVESRTIEQVREHTRPSGPNPTTKAERVNALMEQMLRQARLGRPVTPSEAGDLFAFLASSEAKYLTGQIIALDAGALL